MVKMPNVSVVAETMELRSVTGAYQRDMDVIAALEQIEQATLDVLRSQGGLPGRAR